MAHLLEASLPLAHAPDHHHHDPVPGRTVQTLLCDVLPNRRPSCRPSQPPARVLARALRHGSPRALVLHPFHESRRRRRPSCMSICTIGARTAQNTSRARPGGSARRSNDFARQARQCVWLVRPPISPRGRTFMQRQNGSAVTYTGLCKSIERPSWRTHKLDYSTRSNSTPRSRLPRQSTTRGYDSAPRVTNSIRHSGGWAEAGWQRRSGPWRSSTRQSLLRLSPPIRRSTN